VKANDQVKADDGRVALQRGPLVYCFEWPDNKDASVRHLLLKDNEQTTTSYDANLLDGVEVIKAVAVTPVITKDDKVEEKNETVTAIPYYAWANRGVGDMSVWVADKPTSVVPLPPPTIASKSKVSASYVTKALKSINDQLEPANSHDGSIPYYHWWPKKDTVEWVQYDFEKPATISKIQVYWFDDGPWGGCRIPTSWKLMYKDTDGSWKEVKAKTTYPITKDTFNELEFDAVNTSALRMEVQLSKEHSAGIMEWKVE